MSHEVDADLLEEATDDILAPRRRTAPQGRSSGNGPWIIGAAVVGIVIGVVIYGVWLSGKPAPDSASASPGASASASIDPVVERAQLEQRLADDPSDTEAHMRLGTLLFNYFDDFDGATREFLTVTIIDPTIALAWFNLGVIYATNDPPDNAAARAAWEKVIAIDPTAEIANVAQNHILALPGESPSPPSETPR